MKAVIFALFLVSTAIVGGAGPAAAEDLSLIHISEPTRPYSISYAVFCLNKQTTHK